MTFVPSFFAVSCDAALANLAFFLPFRASHGGVHSRFRVCVCVPAFFVLDVCSYAYISNPKKSLLLSVREENERRIVNGSNYPNTSHDITYSDILSESRIRR